MKVEVYSDVVCPWCYIGKRRFARALKHRRRGVGEIRAVFRPFRLDPSAPSTAVPLHDYLERRYGSAARSMTERVGRIAAEEGISVDWDRALAVDTELAHRLLDIALREHGQETQWQLTEALFDAHFARGADVGDPAVLEGLAASVGMGLVRERLHDEEAIRTTRAAFRAAREKGISAVPTFVFEDRWAVPGAQPTEVFERVLDEVSQFVAEGAGSGTAARFRAGPGGGDSADGAETSG